MLYSQGISLDDLGVPRVGMGQGSSGNGYDAGRAW